MCQYSYIIIPKSCLYITIVSNIILIIKNRTILYSIIYSYSSLQCLTSGSCSTLFLTTCNIMHIVRFQVISSSCVTFGIWNVPSIWQSLLISTVPVPLLFNVVVPSGSINCALFSPPSIVMDFTFGQLVLATTCYPFKFTEYFAVESVIALNASSIVA